MPHYRMKQGDCRQVLKKMQDNFVSSIVTDPPYEIGFMNHGWDSSGIAYEVGVWTEAYRVLKPGGYLLAFGGARTYHRLACAIEDAGFEIRDQIMWVYGSGFPKSLDVSKAIDKVAGVEREVVGRKVHPDDGSTRKDASRSRGVHGGGHQQNGLGDITVPATESAKQWDGWGTALKPAHEPIVVARKPLIGTVVENILMHGTGAMDIKACRIPGESIPINVLEEWSGFGQKEKPTYTATVSTVGRWPANLIHDGSDEVLEAFAVFGDKSSGTASRFFYCAKSSKKERNTGLNHLPDNLIGCSNAAQAAIKRGQLRDRQLGFDSIKVMKNNHPTVKPMALARYLVKLVTPPKGICLDMFAGSGTFVVAALAEGFNAYGIENEQHYVDIAEGRIQHFLHGE